MLDNIKKYHIVLASNSPRRKMLLEGLGIDFEVRVMPDIDESYPDNLPINEIAKYIATKKAAAYRSLMTGNELIITADTIVIATDPDASPSGPATAPGASPSASAKGEVMGKPCDEADARRMLKKLSNNTHQVITGVCLTTAEKQKSFSVTTDVTFKQLTDEEIDYYLKNYRPYDKAGAYGVQEWIGYIGVSAINGSYFNVVGFPVQRIYSELSVF